MTEKAWPKGVFALTLFCEDLEATAEFYRAFLDAEPILEEGDSKVFRAGGTMINLLRTDAVPELIEPAPMAPPGVRAVYTLEVDDVDAEAKRLEKAGIKLLNGPMDRFWGPRTLSVQDPSGHVWELAK